MKEFTLMLLLCLGLAACKNDNQSADTPNTDEQNTEAAADPNATTSDYVPKSKEEEFLLTNFWVFEFYIVPNDHPGSVEKRGTWYTFSPDGTYGWGIGQNKPVKEPGRCFRMKISGKYVVMPKMILRS